jgi:hypothetical protein
MRRTRSVAIVPPLGCVNAATAGIMAMKTGLECHHAVSSGDASLDISSFRLVLCRLSVEERKDCCASEKLDRRELRRRRRSGGAGGEGRAPSVKVAARFNILWRSREGIWEPEAWLSAGALSMAKEATLGGSLGMAITKPRRGCRARHVVREMTTVAVAVPLFCVCDLRVACRLYSGTLVRRRQAAIMTSYFVPRYSSSVFAVR